MPTKWQEERIEAEKPMLKGLNRLGKALHDAEETTMAEKCTRPEIRDLIREVMTNITAEYPRYRQWREGEERPMNGDYRTLRDKVKKPMAKRNLAVKELGHQVHRRDKTAVTAVMEELLQDCLDTHRWHANRRTQIEQQKRAEGRKERDNEQKPVPAEGRQ